METQVSKKVVIILSITSDIGLALAKKYLEKGYTVIGTYRSPVNLETIKSLPNCHLFFYDLNDKRTLEAVILNIKNLNIFWDLFISLPATQKPIGKFFDCNFDEWSQSIHINFIEQLRFLHVIYPYRNKNSICDVALFSGGGSTNKATKNYSAYDISKMSLVKMAELLNFENDNLNVFILGPGWTKTKIHNETLSEPKSKSEESYDKTAEFMKTGTGTSMEDIFGCIEWLCSQGKKISGGRNFSVVYDKWKGDKTQELIKALESDINMYKLRRFKNDFIV